jgi:hypothetical protein
VEAQGLEKGGGGGHGGIGVEEGFGWVGAAHGVRDL